MEVKVICQCGVKFAFDIEPVNGRMPCTIRCPSCDADATTAANAVIADKLGATAPAPAPAIRAVPITIPTPPQPPGPQATPARVSIPTPPVAPAQVARVMSIASPTTATASATPANTDDSGIPHCPRHADEIAAAECFVCAKPICSKCMEQFGFLCSTYCKGQAEAKKMKVPVFAGQILQKAAKERSSQNFILGGAIGLAALLLAAYIYHWFVLSRPKSAFKIETPKSAPFMHAEWIGDDRFYAVTPQRIAMFNAADGEEIWSAELPKEVTATKLKFKDSDDIDDAGGDYSFSSEPTVKTVAKDIWVGLPTRVLRYESPTGKKRQEIALPLPADNYQVGEAHFLAVSSNPTNDAKLLTRINLNNGQIEMQWTPATTGARRVAGVTTFMPGVGNSSLKRMDPNDEDFSDFTSTSFGLDRDYLFTGVNVAHMTRELVESRIAVQASVKPRTGPSKLENPTLRASQALEVAEEFINSDQPDTKIDQSLYSVTIRRFFGGAPEWKGQVTGRPFFYSSKTVDYLTAGDTLIVFNKNNQKLWQAKLTYSISPDYWDREETTGPALEIGNRLLFWDQGVLTSFDLKKGDVQWRVNSVGISGVAPDSEGNIYISSTTAGPEQIKYARQTSITDQVREMIVKVEIKSGKVHWQAARVGASVLVSNGIVYASNSQISGMEVIAASSRGENAGVNWRLFRLDPSNGKDMWEHHRIGVPEAVLARQKRILLRYPDHIRLLKYM